MKIDEIYNILSQNSLSTFLNSPTTESNIIAFENDESIQFPQSFKKMLKFFNGGDIQTPGIEIYGIDTENENGFTYINQANKKHLKIPENYYIIAKLNYGDYICLNFLPPFDVIQWDSSKKRKYLSWNSLEVWLESILNFGSDLDDLEYSSDKKVNTIFKNQGYSETAVSNVKSKKSKLFPVSLVLLSFVIVGGFVILKRNKNGDNNNISSSTYDDSEYVESTVVTSAHTINLNDINQDHDVNQNETSLTNTTYNEVIIGFVNTQNDPLNVRAEPSTMSKVIGEVQKGASVEITGSDDNWYQIRYGSQIGYVSKLYIIIQGENQSPSPITGVVSTEKDPLYIRKKASSDSEKIGEIPKGSLIEIIEDSGEWYYVNYGDLTGYVSKKYVRLSNQPEIEQKIELDILQCSKNGTINSKGAKYVYSYTTDYVCNGGRKVEERLDLEHGWHITAKNMCYSYDLTWYEVWDTDDSDYYGWVDENFISFN